MTRNKCIIKKIKNREALNNNELYKNHYDITLFIK